VYILEATTSSSLLRPLSLISCTTSKGELIIQFFDQDAPVTVANFVGLAQGTIENKAKAKGVPYYDGIVFHRVIKNFMIQGGDPQGTGMGDPGYKFDDEKNDLKHEGKGLLEPLKHQGVLQLYLSQLIYLLHM
jgi:cyclophilin family peptidyl-prolyl cis-trans isomerase